MNRKRPPDGDIAVRRCSPETCDGTHITVMIGQEGKPALAIYCTGAAGARELAALLCDAAAGADRAASVSVLQ